MGVVVSLLGVESYLGEDFGDALVFFLGVDIAVDDQGFRYDVADTHSGAEGGPGILEYGLDGGAVFLQLGAAEGVDVLAFQQDFAVGGLLEAQQEFAGGGFAAAGFTDQAHGFALFDVERDSVDGLHVADGFHHNEAFGDREVFFQAADFQQIVFGSDCHKDSSSSRLGR